MKQATKKARKQPRKPEQPLDRAADRAWDRSAPFDRPAAPLPPGGPQAVADRVRTVLGPVLPEEGGGHEALDRLAALLAAESVQSRHPLTAAHLHCPALPVAVAADGLAAALNASLDSWDQSAAPAVIEDELVAALCGLCYGAPGAGPRPSAEHGGWNPGGTVTTGGTESNLMALLFARDEAVRRSFDTDPAEDGVPAYAAGRIKILTSAVAHFSLARAAAQLGLGERSVVPVEVLPDQRMDPAALERTAAVLAADDKIIAAVVATAGTTDAGAIDPLASCARVARRHGAWFHVDAAYGGALLFSSRRRGLLAGVEQADSVALDLHKLGWQPIPAGLFLVRDQAAFAPLTRRVAYLSALDDERAGYPNLLGRSLRTTRRADAVKIAATCQALGRRGLDELIERCFELAAYAAQALRDRPEFELAAEPALTTVLFRYRARVGEPDRVNAAARRRLLAEGSAVVGRAELPGPDGKPAGPGALRLKLTLINPDATPADLDRLLDLIAAAAAAEDRA